MITRLRHFWLVITRLPGILLNQKKRALLAEAAAFLRALPAKFERPLPMLMADITPTTPKDSSPTTVEKSLREIADIAAILDRRSPLGLCLRRSLIRYYFLRSAGLPVEIKFGARFVSEARFQDGNPDRQVTGHAWLTLDGQPYYEADENWRGFTVMLTYPQPAA